MKRIKISGIVFLSLLLLFAVIFGAALGGMMASTVNIKNTEHFTQFNTALPTKLLDINGEIITEFASDEKREIIAYQKLPQHLIDALITREDRIFFSHNGFSFKAVSRAIVGKLVGSSLGGGSTLTQQIAGTLYCDRTEMSIKRKLKELWWALQMERRYSKNEILELYLNKIYFGGGTYGVNAASKYYFGHAATEITPAESGILVIQLSNPAFYNPFDHPNRAMERQMDVLNSMVDAGYITREQADLSYEDYWAKFDFTRTSTSAYMMRADKAPWFSEYVRRELGKMLYGSDDIYSSGFTVNTTLNLAHEDFAQELMIKYIDQANKSYRSEHDQRTVMAYRTYIPFAELLAVMFGIPKLKVGKQRGEMLAKSRYINNVNPVLDLVAMMTGNDVLKADITNQGTKLAREEDERNTIEGTMISMETGTGYINALIGGSKYDSDNQFIRATQARIQPGSTFKPLYYSAAIDSKKFTPTTQISDTPVVFYTPDGKPYIPQNFKGEWMGNVSVYYALTRSMNVPSLKVLDGIGFDAAINRAASLLGISDDELESRAFVPGYPIGLGVCSVRPIEVLRAFSIFQNGGKVVKPIAIKTVEDKNGDIVMNPEQDAKNEIAAMGDKAQVITPQTAFVMTKMLEQTVNNGGTLQSQRGKFFFKDEKGKTYRQPAAGKTGTTQNWADAWSVGFTNYYTAVFWFGFDKPGQSLGLNSTGATLAGNAWGDFFEEIHKDLPAKQFEKPDSGVVQLTVCAKSGALLSKECGDDTTTQWYLTGTQPYKVCPIHTNHTTEIISTSRMEEEMVKSGIDILGDIDTSGLVLDLDFLNDDYVEPVKPAETTPVSAEEDDFNFLME